MYLQETKAKLRAEFPNATGLQLQDLALIRWKSPGLDQQLKADLVASQAALLQEWLARPAAERLGNGSGSGSACAPAKVHSTAHAPIGRRPNKPPKPSKAARRRGRMEVLTKYIEACGGEAAQLKHWSARKDCRSKQLCFKYYSPSGDEIISLAGVARALGLTPLDPAAAGRFQFQRRQAQGGSGAAVAAAASEHTTLATAKRTADVAGLESALPDRKRATAGGGGLSTTAAAVTPSHESLVANLDLRVTSTGLTYQTCADQLGALSRPRPPDHTCMHTCPRVALLQ